MSKRDRKRRELFDDYAANLTAYSRLSKELPQVTDVYVCPFCGQMFDRSALDHPPKVSIEHGVPDALGGTLATSTLICTCCNNRMGEKIDVHLANRLKTEAFFKGESNQSRRIWVTAAGQRVRADWFIEQGEGTNHTIRYDERRSPKGAVEALQAAMPLAMSDPAKFTMQVSFEFSFIQRITRVALLRIGFLRMFRQFGYAYIFHPNVQRVREQILNPREEIIPEKVIAFEPKDLEREIDWVGIVHTPQDWKSFVVPVRLTGLASSTRRRIGNPSLCR